jgi:predicted transcriptional regulator
MDKDVKETLLRRPCTKEDLRSSLGLTSAEVDSILKKLINADIVYSSINQDNTYYHAKNRYPTIREIEK